MNAETPYWVRRLIAELGRDKKKTIALAVLGLVAVIVFSRLLLGGSGPDEAQASPVAAAVIPQGAKPDGFNLVADVLQEASSKRQAKRDEYIRSLSREVNRDLFAVDLNIYPLVELPKSVEPKDDDKAPKKSEPFVKKLTKEQIVLSQSKLLCLQMTIVSDKSTAIINSQVLGVGDTIDVNLDGGSIRFRVVEITSHGCVVARDGVRVTLQMK